MLLKNIKYLVTQNSRRQILKNIDVRIKNDKIEAIGHNLENKKGEAINCEDKIVMPGLINAHTHAPMTLLRGISDNKKLEEWLHEDIFPAEQKMTGQDIYLGTVLGGMEMLKTGTTTFNDMYDEMNHMANAVETVGIRAVLSKGIIDKDQNKRQEINQALQFVKDYQGHELIKPGFSPHAIYTVKEQTLKELKDYAEVFDTIYHIHVSETKEENEESIQEHGKTPVQYLDSINTVNHRFVGAHGVWLEQKDIETLSHKDASIVHNPYANLKLGSGIASVQKMLEKGVNVALGTDGVASNNNLNLFEEMKVAVNLQKKENPEKISEQEILDMATINGAKALDMEDEIGSIAVGKKADLLVIDAQDLEMNPVHGERGLISNLVYSFNGHPEHVIVNGDFRVRNKHLIDINEEFILEKIRETAEKF